MSRTHLETIRRRSETATPKQAENNTKALGADSIRQEALANRMSGATSPVDMSIAAEARQSLFAKMGYDFMHVDDLTPHPENDYSMDERKIEKLAEILYESNNTQPLVVRIEPNTRTNQILVGERRWRAHKLLASKYGEAWSMVAVRNVGVISDEEALFILDSDNLATRDLTASERARGSARMAKTIEARRKNDPEYRAKHKGQKTRDIIAEETGVSQTTVSNDLRIHNGLVKEAKNLLDSETLKVRQALEMTKLPEEKQKSISLAISTDGISSDQIDEIIEEAKTGETGKQKRPQKEKTTNSLMTNACNSLKKAVSSEEEPDPKLVAKLKKYVLELDERVNRRLTA